MKLNPECIRMVLLTIENELTLDDNFKPKRYYTDDLLQSKALSEFNNKDIIYSLIQLSKNGYIDIHDIGADQRFIARIIDITPLGHEFINHIRPKSVWDNIMDISKKTSNFSFNALATIALNVGQTHLTESINTFISNQS